MSVITRALLTMSLAIAAACGGSESDDVDLAAPDLSVLGTPCSTVLTCFASSSGPARTACLEAGSPHARVLMEAVFTCGYLNCTLPPDGGVAVCSSNLFGGTPTPECSACVTAAVQSPACALQFQACFAN